MRVKYADDGFASLAAAHGCATLRTHRLRESVMSKLRVTLRVDFDPNNAIGPGKVALLEKMRDCGSLSQAARRSRHELSPRLAVARRVEPVLSRTARADRSWRQRRRRFDIDHAGRNRSSPRIAASKRKRTRRASKHFGSILKTVSARAHVARRLDLPILAAARTAPDFPARGQAPKRRRSSRRVAIRRALHRRHGSTSFGISHREFTFARGICHAAI